MDGKDTDPVLCRIVAYEIGKAYTAILRMATHITAAYPPTMPSFTPPETIWNANKQEEDPEWKDVEESKCHAFTVLHMVQYSAECARRKKEHKEAVEEVAELRPSYAELLSLPPSLADDADSPEIES